ncbi:hypothetical protein M0R36_02650 [bacterium]|jgi:hypothetical protein|nr:hypothetical protein [bacterium]
MRWRCKEVHLSKTASQNRKRKGSCAKFVSNGHDGSDYYAVFPVTEVRKHIKD